MLLSLLFFVCPCSVWAQGQRLEIEGIGRTDEDARNSALRGAREAILAYLRLSDPPISSWSPSLEFVQNSLTRSEPGDPRETPDGSFARTWIVELSLPDEATLRQWDNQRWRGRIAFFAALGAIAAIGMFTGACWFWERRMLQREAV